MDGGQRAAGSGAGLLGTALDVLQHQRQAQRDNEADHVSTGGGFLKLGRNVTPRLSCAMLLGQMPHEFPHITERPERHDLRNHESLR